MNNKQQPKETMKTTKIYYYSAFKNETFETDDMKTIRNKKRTTIYYLAYAFNTLFLLSAFILISLIALN